MKKLSIILLAMALALAFSFPLWSASTTDYLLQRSNQVTGQGLNTWSLNGMTIVTTITQDDNTFAYVDATDIVTLVGGGTNAEAGTQPMFQITLTAGAGSVTWDAGDLLTLVHDTGGTVTTDCSGITLTACNTAVQALSTVLDGSFVVAVGDKLPDSSYTDYYEPEAASDLAATALSIGGSGETTVAIAMGDATLFDTAALDFTNKTIAYFKTTMEAMYGGSQITVTINQGLPTTLTNGMNDMDNESATDYESALTLEFGAGDPAMDAVYEDRYTSVTMCNYMVDVGTTGFFQVYDGATKIWQQLLVDGATTYTSVPFYNSVSRTGSNTLSVRLQSSDAMTAAQLICLGRTD